MFEMTDEQKCALGAGLCLFGGKSLLEKAQLVNDEPDGEGQSLRALYNLVIGLIVDACLRHSEGKLRPNPNPAELYSQFSPNDYSNLLILGSVGENALRNQRANWGEQAYRDTLLQLLLSEPTTTMRIVETGNVVIILPS